MPAPPRPDGYELARPIFDRSKRRFHPITELLSFTDSGTALDLRLAVEDGPPVVGRLTFADTHVARLQWSYASEIGDHLTDMLVGAPARLPLNIRVTDDTVAVDAGGPPVVLEKRPWRVRFGEFVTQRDDIALTEHVAEPGGWALDGDEIVVYETFALRPNEELFGLGERFLGPRLRGRRLAHWIEEPFGTNTADRLHKSVPLVISSRGYGIFAHHGEEGVFDLGATSTASGSVLVHADELDLFLLLGTPKEILARYTALTGRSPVPPEWSFGVWMSKCMYESRAEIQEVLSTAKAVELPIDVVNVDPMWLANRPGKDWDFCDFVWNEQDFGPMPEFIDWLHGEGVRLCLWVNPHLHEAAPTFVPELLVEQGRVRWPYGPALGFVDLTGKGGAWWRDGVSGLAAAGVDALKLDYGEALPRSATMADGRTGRDVHNLFPLMMSQLAAEAGIPLVFTRGGTAGSQRYPLHWSGDAQATWEGFAGALRGGLAAAWSGFAHWTTDIGGFYGRNTDAGSDSAQPAAGLRRPEPELFIRWMQFGMLLSHTRFHGLLGREPWLYGDDAVRIARDFSSLRRSLRPYLLECAREAAETGCPIMRPLAMEFPDDIGSRAVDTGYLLGPGLLVYPVLERGGRVDIYVPPGEWHDRFTAETYQGPCWVERRDVPLDELPLLVRSGHSPFSG